MATDAENHESVGFDFGRQSNSTYKFARIRKNLDLFVMERNERHLTSLHWNWQKLSKTDDTAGTDANKPENCFTPVISSPDNSARQIEPKIRSRAQSRHMLQEIPPGVAHEDLDMTDEGGDIRTVSPYVTSSISDKIKAIKNQLSELNEEIDSKIANPDLELEAEMNEQPPAYTFSNPEMNVIDATLPEECISADQDAEPYLRSTDGFIELQNDLVDDERFMTRNTGPAIEQQAWKQDELETYKGATAPYKSDLVSSTGSDCLRKLDDEYVQNSRNTEAMEYSPDFRGTSHYTTLGMARRSREFGVRTSEPYQVISPVSSKKTIRSPETRPDVKERKHSRDYKASDSPEIKQSLPFCRHSIDSIQDSTASLTFSDSSSEKGIKTNTATTRRKSVKLDVPGVGLRIPRQNSNNEADAETGEQKRQTFFARTIDSMKELYNKRRESKKSVIVVASSPENDGDVKAERPKDMRGLVARILKNTGFRKSSHRVINSTQKNDLEVFPESEKDSGCQPGYGRESASTLWRSNLSGKRSGSCGKNQEMDSTVSVSQVRNRFFDEDKNSQGDVLEEIDFEAGPIMHSSSSIPKASILENDEGTISEISGDFLNEKAERDKFSNNDSSEIWTEKRAESKRSLLEGLGTSYCVLPNFIWKYVGQDTDDEPMTRKKCIAFILGAILAVLLIALLLGLIIGIATSASPEDFSPIRFSVIPGIPAADENLGDSAPE